MSVQGGICAVLSSAGDAARLTAASLFTLQYRGTQCAGLTAFDSHRQSDLHGVGLVRDVIRLNEDYYTSALGAVFRKVTIQPIKIAQGVVLAVCGRLTDSSRLVHDELVSRLQLERGGTLSCRLISALSGLNGVFVGVMATPSELLAFCDSSGLQTLVIGQLATGWCVATESCGFGLVQASYMRKVGPGQLVRLTSDDLVMTQFAPSQPRQCSMQLVSLMRPDSCYGGGEVHSVRVRSGAVLAREAPATGDVVVAVPDAAMGAAVGYATEAGIRFDQAIFRNRYPGATELCQQFNILPETVNGKRVVIVENAVHTGRTLTYVVKSIREAGAGEVHVRVASPPIRSVCLYANGVEQAGRLIAGRSSVEEIRQFLDVETLAFLSEAGLQEAIKLTAEQTCRQCMAG